MKHKFTLVLLSLLLGLQCMVAQQIKVTGVVINEDDEEPIIGASIIVKGTTIGTVTDLDGAFSLDADKKAHLQVSYVGMKTQEVAVQPKLRITLAADAQNIDEIVVVAYGTTKKSSFTGSAATVSSQSIEKRALTNVVGALEGTTSGVQVTSSSGQPGSSPDIRIRGFGSVNSSNKPLYVVDGSIYNGEVGDINPADIESMTVLKDAASTSLYGSSAGNGVILITTKKAKGDGSHSVNLSISQGFSNRAIKEYDRVGTMDYYPLQWEMLKNQYQFNSKYSPEKAAATASEKIFSQLKYNPFKGIDNAQIVGTDGRLNPAANTLLWGDDLDWEDAAYRTGIRSEYNLSYSSKTEKSDTYASLGYLNEHGYMIKTDMERFSGRVNYNIYPVKWLKTGLNLSGTRNKSNVTNAGSDNSSGYGNMVRFVRGMAPIYPIYQHDPVTGDYLNEKGEKAMSINDRVYDYAGPRISNTGRHTIAEAEWNDRLNERDALNARTYLDLNIYDGLKVSANVSLESTNLRKKVYENTKVGDGSPAGRMNITSSRSTTYTFNQLITYNKDFGQHSIDALLGHENYSYTYQYMYGMRQEQSIIGLQEFGNFVSINALSSYTNNYKKEGYFLRANYDYKDTYYASVSYRHDGTSRFHNANRWGDFWSFGASWRIDQEKFMDNLNWVNSLKLRASYGETGNDGVLDDDGYQNYYAYQTLYDNGMNNKFEPGIFFKLFGNPELKWETQVSTDVAIEFGLFDKLTGSVEYFSKNSKDLLFSVPTPTSTGVQSIWKNLGKVVNDGVEINLDYQVYKNKDWRVNVGANATFIRNEVKSMPEGQKEIIDGNKKISEGHSMYDFWMKQYYGVNPDNGAALYLFDDGQTGGIANQTWSDKDCLEKDGQKLTTNQSKAKYDYSGSAIPTVFGGFNIGAKYKDFELSTVFSYALGGKIYNSSYAVLMNNVYGYAMHTDVFNAWKQEGDITDVPRLDQSQKSNFDAASTRFLTSSDYLSLRSVTFAYNLPKSILQPIGMKSARISASGENLFQINTMQGLNCLANYSGTTYNEYQPARSITFTLNVAF